MIKLCAQYNLKLCRGCQVPNSPNNQYVCVVDQYYSYLTYWIDKNKNIIDNYLILNWINNYSCNLFWIRKAIELAAPEYLNYFDKCILLK